jgi:hypothetical protein
MKNIQKSSFAGLVSYITDVQNKNERVGCVTVTNCYQQDATDAVMEIEATQRQNTRALSDRTYHIIISFRDGENPDQKVLKAIEARICEELGFGKHQRISAVHHDTDNMHIHVAINKIHPTRFTIHEPYYDYKILGRLCEKLEIEYGLERDNHKSQKQCAENRAQDLERHTGVESLLGFIKRECLSKLKLASTWIELHKILNENGLEIKEQGNGLIVADQQSNLMVKASSIDRDFSKGKLEVRFGKFEKSNTSIFCNKLPKNSRYYAQLPMKTKIDTTEYYAKYKTEYQDMSSARMLELTSIRARKNQLIEKVKRYSKLKRSTIKLMKNDGINKKILYSLASKSIQHKLEKINKQYLKDRQKIYSKYERHVWVDWLNKKAIEGDNYALKILRARDGREDLKGNTISGKLLKNTEITTNLQLDNITKKGTIIYNVGVSSIRDDGKFLEISRDASTQNLEILLRMAMQRYGSCLSINGSEQFKKRIIYTAVRAKINVVFDDPVSEKLRHFFNSLTNHQEEKHEHSQIEREQQNRGGENRGSAFGNRPVFRSRVVSGFSSKRDPKLRFRGQRSKPYPSGIGCQPPPERKNCLRNLSQLNVVRFSGGSEMLLSSNVSRQLEHKRTQPAHHLRRDIHRTGITVDKFKKSNKNGPKNL